MAKNDENDKLKEELAESRHEEITTIMLGTFAFGGFALAIAFGAWQWQLHGLWQGSLAFFGTAIIIGLGYWGISNAVSRRGRERKDKIKQLGKDAEKPAPDNGAREPTLRAIMEKLHKIQDEIKKGNKNTLAFSMAFCGISLALAGSIVLLQTGVQLYIGWMLTTLGAVVVAFAFFYLGKLNK